MENQLLKVEEIAKGLRVPISWVYSQTRMPPGPNTIPYVRVGKYLRFEFEKVLKWLESKQAKQRDLS